MVEQTAPASTPTRCVGLGRIFGHKFTHHIGDWVYPIDFCRRCGIKRPGLWR